LRIRASARHHGACAADVAVATALQIVQPPPLAVVHLSELTWRKQHDDELAADFPDLLEWRSWLFAEHGFSRPAPGGAAQGPEGAYA
jgi:hypothetical protein